MTRSTYHRNGTQPRAATILAYVRQHPNATTQTIAAAIGVHWQTVRNHLINLKAEGLVVYQSVPKGNGPPEYQYTATEAGQDADLDEMARARNLPVERRTAKKRKRVEWVNPLKGTTVAERIEELYRREIEHRLAPSA